ncbi:MAG: hypothetical protein GWO08_18385 [Gammaproteobacteria bacterium]|nr:hypothetical protein [candidate division Zixibacteria bacterium]NIR95532.1 hypothetical protein [Gammaproteobacteria bacterium]NIR64820.1 hypothetical protein [candidate division Zixibacteria bacterium]NIS46641.1 hypothetical protein [candidate division Zixibacteria bacterium]NIT53763.1 hypothetical protein [candidate division Zixibacteria bacterium]
MDPVLREMCLEVLRGNVNSDKFAGLMIESGIDPKGVEWDMAARLLEKGDEMRLKLQKFGQSVH